MRIRLGYAVAILLSALVATAPAEAQKKTLVIGLNQDPDILDPTLARTYVGRIIFEHMCEKLYEIDESLKIFPQLAAELPAFSDAGKTVTIKLRAGVKFNDGTPMTAEAVKFSLDRHREMKGSSRRSELDHVDAVDVVDPTTVRLRLKAPFSPITAILADRAGMPVSPTQARKLDDKFGTAPVCVGPWAFAERVAQDRIVLDKSTHYFDPGQAKFDRLVFRIITDDNVRLANLRSGDIDFMHLVSPTHAASLKKEGKFDVSSVAGIGYSGINLNLRNKNGKPPAAPGDLGTPLANDPRVREAFELSIDREALNQVVWEGQYTPDCTPISPVSPFYDKSRKCSVRDVARAKKLLADAGLAGGYSFELTVQNQPPERRVGEVHPGDGQGGRVQRHHPALRVRLGAERRRRRQAARLPGGLERPRGPGREHPPVPYLPGEPEHDPGVRRGRRLAPDPGPGGERPEGARGSLPAGHRPDRRAPQPAVPLPPELHRGLPEEPQGLQGRARRADPDQGRELELG